jgi:hypothetical protein
MKPPQSPTFIEDSFTPVLSEDGSIIAERRCFEVRPSSKQFRLLTAMAAQKSGLLPRSQLIGVMYGDVFEADPTKSLTTTANRYQTGVKTLSRLRIELERFFGDITPPGFDWLPWSEKLGGWLLFRQGRVDQARG